MASHIFEGMHENIIETSFEEMIRIHFGKNKVDAKLKDIFRKFFFAGADITSGTLIILAEAGADKELLKCMISLKKELLQFRTDQLSLIEKQVELNG